MSFSPSPFLTPYHHAHQSYTGSPKDKVQKPSPQEKNGTTATDNPQSASPTSDSNSKTKHAHNRKRLVFADPVAFRYLEEDPACHAIERWRRLQGYEIYLVEQWACSRTHPTFAICTYTGDLSHSILVSVLSVPSDESTWSPRLQIYFQAVSEFHAKEKDTPLGALMVTNLSAFPSALTVIAVPDGELRKHREDFIVNENLKRMGCSGRGSINLQQPQPSTVAKFHHLYRTSDSVPLYQSVMELVRVCQTALVMYDKLQPTYADGLLCDLTEKAVSDWWTDIGTYFYNVEPSDGILGPTTVAAILGLLVGAYNRLKASGSPVGKDVLDTISMKRAIGHFQKSQKLEKSRRLDRDTIDRLHRATAKNASGEGWTVPKAVKSTVAELSGKGGEMVMGIVGARDKAGISDAETMDIERFAELVTGPRMKWLWQGKPVKSGDLFAAPDDDHAGRVFRTDEQGNYFWTSNQHHSISDGIGLERTDTSLTSHTQDGKSGRSRIRDAVEGLKTSSHRTWREGDEAPDWLDSVTTAASKSSHEAHSGRDHTLRPPLAPRQTGPPAFDMALANARPTSAKDLRGQPSWKALSAGGQPLGSHREQLRSVLPGDSPRRKKLQAEMAGLRNEFKADIYRNFSTELPYKGLESRILRRSQSAVQLVPIPQTSPRQNRINRRLSFSIVERAVLDIGPSVAEEGVERGQVKGDLTNAMAERDSLVAAAQRRARRIQAIQQGLVPYTESRVAHVENIDNAAHQHLEQLNELYYQRLEEYQTLQATSSDIVSHEKIALTESFRRMEMLGAKMDYELDALHSRWQEVEDGLNDFERAVQDIEQRVKELLGEERRNSVPWIQRLLNLMGSRSRAPSKSKK